MDGDDGKVKDGDRQRPKLPGLMRLASWRLEISVDATPTLARFGGAEKQPFPIC